jgi:hypothetical protein
MTCLGHRHAGSQQLEEPDPLDPQRASPLRTLPLFL